MRSLRFRPAEYVVRSEVIGCEHKWMVMRVVSLQTSNPNYHVAAKQAGVSTASMAVRRRMQADGSGPWRPLIRTPYLDAVHSDGKCVSVVAKWDRKLRERNASLATRWSSHWAWSHCGVGAKVIGPTGSWPCRSCSVLGMDSKRRAAGMQDALGTDPCGETNDKLLLKLLLTVASR